jgi:D-alanine-D-alanine ligase-like ATP-grasp enzyme/acylphosphatase
MNMNSVEICEYEKVEAPLLKSRDSYQEEVNFAIKFSLPGSKAAGYAEGLMPSKSGLGFPNRGKALLYETANRIKKLDSSRLSKSDIESVCETVIEDKKLRKSLFGKPDKMLDGFKSAVVNTLSDAALRAKMSENPSGYLLKTGQQGEVESSKVSGIQVVSYKEPVARSFASYEEADQNKNVNVMVKLAGSGESTLAGYYAEGYMPSLSGRGFPQRAKLLLDEAYAQLVSSIDTVVASPLPKVELTLLVEKIADTLDLQKRDQEGNLTKDNFLQGYKKAVVQVFFEAVERFKLGSRTSEYLVLSHSPNVRGGEINKLVAFYEHMLPVVKEYKCYPEMPWPTFEGRKPCLYDDVPYLRPLGGNGSKGHMLERQALAYGLQTIRYSKGAFVASDKKKHEINFKWSRSPISSNVSLSLTTHKEATRARLRRKGVPVPRGRLFKNGDYESGIEFAERIGYPVVCKPATGVRGIGVFANIQSLSHLNKAFEMYKDSQLGGDDFIIEKHIPGKDYRIVVLNGKVLAAILREPASVVGDGKHNIAELVMHKNMFRRENPHLWARPIKCNDALLFQLERIGKRFTDIPKEGETVILGNSCSLSQGGDSVDVLDEMHPSIIEASEASVKAIPGLEYCGVDFLLEDHTKPLSEQIAGICELNAHAAIGNCEYPFFGTPREVARNFLKRCAELKSVEISPQPAKELSLKIKVRGKVTGVGYRKWFAAKAEEFGLQGWVRNASSREVEAVIYGPTIPASALAAAAVLGPAKAIPTSVRTSHVAKPENNTFEIRQ